MYCIDTEALVFMFNRGSSYGLLFIRFSPGFAGNIFTIRASDMVLAIFFYILAGFIYVWGTKGPPSQNSVTPGSTKAT